MTLIEIAQKYIGVKELKPNRGFVIKDTTQAGFEEGMRAVGWKSGLPWCAFLVKYLTKLVYGDAHKALTGGVHSTWESLKNSTSWELSKSPLVGGIVLWDSGNAHGHTGIVTAISGLNIITIEGNTDKGGSREGDGIYVRTRPIAPTFATYKLELLGYARYKQAFTEVAHENDPKSVQQG